MPAEPSSIAAAIQAAAPDLTGPVWPRFTTAIGIGVASWIVNPANFGLVGVTTGVAGSGTVTGKFTVVPNVFIVATQMSSANLTGRNVTPMARAAAIGVATSLTSTALYQGVSAGVGTGSDVSVVSLSNATTLIASLQVACSTVGYTGANVASLCTGLGNGIALMLQAGTGFGASAGPSGPSPAVGSSTSWIV
jgi:hypothetical protein